MQTFTLSIKKQSEKFNIVVDVVQDMETYPPLPDILLDNLPHIPWAFEMCEVSGMVLLIVWVAVVLFHKHRFILLRRFFSISGTIFLLRCVTMLITSLSVPGTKKLLAHSECLLLFVTFYFFRQTSRLRPSSLR